MGEIAGVKISTVIFGIAAAGLFLLFTLFLLTGPNQLLTATFAVVDQGLATATLSINSLVSAGGTVIEQGMGVVGDLVSQAGFLVDQAVAGAASIVNQGMEVAAIASTTIATTVATLVTTSTTVITSAVVGMTAGLTAAATAIPAIYLNAQSAIIQFYTGLVSIAVTAAEQIVSSLAIAISQIFTTAFTSVAAVFGQLISIPLILINGAISVTNTIASVPVALFVAGMTIFVKLFSFMVSIFTDPAKFLNIIKSIATTIGTKIIEGFTTLVEELPKALKSVFAP